MSESPSNADLAVEVERLQARIDELEAEIVILKQALNMGRK